jgi:PAS domain S-box-containing protein
MEKSGTNEKSNPTDRLIRFIVEHTQTKFGREYFKVLVRHLAEGLKVVGAWVTELHVNEQKLESLAFWLNGKYVDHYVYDLVNTPCEQVIKNRECFLVPEKVIELFPKDPDLAPLNAVSYMGYPLFGEAEEVIGHLAIINDAPLHPNKEQEAVFRLFLQRANAEFLRLKAYEELEEKKFRLSSLIDSMHEAILEVDAYGFITLANPASESLFGIPQSEFSGFLIFSLFEEESAAYIREILKNTRSNLGITTEDLTLKELHVFSSNGAAVPVQCSFCHYTVNGNQYHTVLLRNLKDLRRVEQRLQLIEENQKDLTNHPSSHPIVGESKAIKRIYEDLENIAESSSTVLLLGESGTGKEVFARFIHDLSPRKSRPMVIVNCAAIPSNLVESEFFGHEKGAFTGAVQRKEGRFLLADGGTLFLDEIGEIPLDMQPKLLRVLQEGEYEPVGGSRSIKVNVRIIAATNRNLEDMVNKGNFREDLYYRLNVIPVNLPPLRERGNDIVLLADLFLKKFSKRAGKKVRPLDNEDVEILLGYNWPGNIRELQHVMERAVILAKDDRLQLKRFIPYGLLPGGKNEQKTDTLPLKKILTNDELTQLEKQNLFLALEKSNWKISGSSGAAALLGIPPTTLNSKIKALGILKPS